ncbi:hypothetical protein lerEdw1_014367 [Lerista edwardsae]|nr:hypothetical protein lerEdw1_014367 [Lerista edwardsae]
MPDEEEKVNLRRLEPAIQKFTKVAVPTDLERLRKHQINIEKYQRCRLWDRLHEEHINAGRTVQPYFVTASDLCATPIHHEPKAVVRGLGRRSPQCGSGGGLLIKFTWCRVWEKLGEAPVGFCMLLRTWCYFCGRFYKSTNCFFDRLQQLRANIREMEKLCLRVRREDALALQRMISPVKEEASLAIRKFLQLHSESAEELKRQFNEREASPQPPLTRSATLGADSFAEGSSPSLHQTFSPLPEIPQDQHALESWETLEEDLIELGQLVTDFSLLVNAQQEKIDRIEDNVGTAVGNVEEGTHSLRQAAKYKLAALPVAGALLGGVLGGPIGLLAGFKVAGIAAALGGGVLGFTGGKLIQRKKQRMLEDAPSSSSSSSSSSRCPHLPQQQDSSSSRRDCS